MTKIRGAVVVLSVLFTVGLLGMPGGAWGQVEPSSLPDTPEPRTFGVAAEIAHVIAAAEFDTIDSTNTWSYTIFVHPTIGILIRDAGTIGVTTFLAGLRLPAGAEVTRLEIAGCDSTATGNLQFLLFRSKLPPGTGLDVVTAEGDTGIGPTSGCGRFSVTPSSPPLIIDNANASYFIRVITNGTGFDSVRVFYRLQVSPAPAVASFGDVPTGHPFFRFIEALKASGITGGCQASPPLYCPDAPLTRGQMAVFLSTALGLHFAP
jgi:hypothetical protein